MSDPGYIPRHLEPRLVEALGDSPVVLVHGPRQCGKTTLARHVGERLGYGYFTLDDPVLREAAAADPAGFLDGLPRRTIVDEVQRVPDLLPAIKLAVDRDRVPGRFLLTGSAHVLFLPRLSESLAGRMEIARLHPFSRAELAGRPAFRFVDLLFQGDFPARTAERLGAGLAEAIAAGGYPPALARKTARRRAAWYRDYVTAIVERDVRDLARIRSGDVLPRLLRAVAGATATLLNVSDLAAPFEVSRPTIIEYLELLERVFLVDRLPAWRPSRVARLVKAPKLHVGDTGLGCALLGVAARGLGADRDLLGRMLETFVLEELRRQASGRPEPVAFSHFRDKDGREVDIVIEDAAGRVAGVEVKAAATVRPADFKGLRRLRTLAGDRFAAGVVLYDGEAQARLDDRLYAVPVRRLWEGGKASR